MSERARVLLGSLGSLLLAALLLLVVILPAEYGFDPLGTGTVLGLTGMADAGEVVVDEQAERWQSDCRRFEIGAFESLEVKYRLDANETLLFDWQASGEVVFDLHAEPDGAAPGYAESFSQGRGDGASGSYHAPFGGIHGWFWQNRNQNAVVIDLEVSGYADWVIEFRDGFEQRYDFHHCGP